MSQHSKSTVIFFKKPEWQFKREGKLVAQSTNGNKVTKLSTKSGPSPNFETPKNATSFQPCPAQTMFRQLRGARRKGP